MLTTSLPVRSRNGVYIVLVLCNSPHEGCETCPPLPAHSTWKCHTLPGPAQNAQSHRNETRKSRTAWGLAESRTIKQKKNGMNKTSRVIYYINFFFLWLTRMFSSSSSSHSSGSFLYSSRVFFNTKCILI